MFYGLVYKLGGFLSFYCQKPIQFTLVEKLNEALAGVDGVGVKIPSLGTELFFKIFLKANFTVLSYTGIALRPPSSTTRK